MRAFTEHPDAVGETYLEHLHSACGFAATMFVGSVACFLHGLLPFAFQKSGSRRIVDLHQRMVANRNRGPHARPSPTPAEPQGFLGLAEGI